MMKKEFKRKKRWTGKYNAMAVFDIPVKIKETDVYGLLLYLEDDEDMEHMNHRINIYINNYLIPMSRIVAKGEFKEGKWYFPQYGIDVEPNMGLYKFFEVLFDDLVGFKLIQNGHIVCKRKEADDDFIIDRAVIDRYDNKEKQDTN